MPTEPPNDVKDGIHIDRIQKLRDHHEERAAMYDRTQPSLDATIHQETARYLKNSSFNGTKSTKSQKPRATKRQHQAALQSSASSTTLKSSGLINNSSHQPTPTKQTPPNSLPKNSMPPANAIQATTIQPPNINNYMQRNSMQPGTMQQQNVTMQSTLPQPSSNQTLNYQHQQTHQSQYQHNHQSIQRQVPQQHQQIHSSHLSSQGRQTQQQMIMHQNNIINSNINNNGTTNRNIHFRPGLELQQTSVPTNTTMATHNLTMKNNYSMNSNNYLLQNQYQNFVTPMMPNDLDLNALDGGLECDVESVIRHELSYEDSLNFNPDLFRKLDGFNGHTSVNKYL